MKQFELVVQSCVLVQPAAQSSLQLLQARLKAGRPQESQLGLGLTNRQATGLIAFSPLAGAGAGACVFSWQLEESEFTSAVAVKARKSMEVEMEDLHLQIDDLSKAKAAVSSDSPPVPVPKRGKGVLHGVCTAQARQASLPTRSLGAILMCKSVRGTLGLPGK